jgi:hypothetical protein
VTDNVFLEELIMNTDISLLQTIINGGPALIIAIGLVFVWRAWRKDVKEHKEEIESLNSCLNDLQEQRVNDAIDWSNKYNQLADHVRGSVEVLKNFTGMVERALSRGGSDA